MRSVIVGLVAVLLVSTAWGQEKLVLPWDTTDGVLAERLKGLTKLERLELSLTNITDAGLIHLKGLTALKELSPLTTITPQSGCPLARWAMTSKPLTSGIRRSNSARSNGS